MVEIMQNFILYRKRDTHKPLVFLFPYDVSSAHLPILRHFYVQLSGVIEIIFDYNFRPQQEAFVQVQVKAGACYSAKEVSQKDIDEVKKFVRNLIK